MADIKIVGDTVGEELPIEPKEEAKADTTISPPVLPQLEEKAIAQVMGLERESDIDSNRSKIQELLEYAKGETKDHSLENLKWVIRSLELKLGTPPFAEKRINYVTRYAYLLKEEKKLKAERAKFERPL